MNSRDGRSEGRRLIFLDLRELLGAREHRDAPVEVETKRGLGRRERIVSEALLVQHRPLAQGRVREESYLLPAAEIINGLLVVEDVRLGFVNGRSNLAEFE